MLLAVLLKVIVITHWVWRAFQFFRAVNRFSIDSSLFQLSPLVLRSSSVSRNFEKKRRRKTICRHYRHLQGPNGSSNGPWLSWQTGPISSGVTRNSGAYSFPSFPLILFMTDPPFPSPVNGVSRLTYFNTWCGGPPGRRTKRPTWQAPGILVARSAPSHLS